MSMPEDERLQRSARDVLADRIKEWFGVGCNTHERADQLLTDLDVEHYEIVRVDEWGDVIRLGRLVEQQYVRYVALADEPTQDVKAGDVFDAVSLAPEDVRLGIVPAALDQ